MSSLKIDVDEDKLDALFVEHLKKYINIIESDFKTAWHPGDKMMYIQVYSACLTLIQWMSTHTDFNKFMEQTYGSKSDQGE